MSSSGTPWGLSSRGSRRRSGIPQKQVCADSSVSTSALQAWGEAQLAAHSPPTSGGDPEATRANAQTLKRTRELEENEVLRRAAAYLSQANLRPPE
jgi:transposase